MKTKKRNIITIILAAICAVLMVCTMGLVTGVTSKTAYALKSEDDLDIGNLTLANYDSTQDEVFDRAALDKLYDALTGGNGKTLPAVRNTVLGLHSDTYGYDTATVNLPEYKTAADLYDLNGGKNIVVSLAGQQFAVSFLTTAQIGGKTHVIATLWMTQPLTDGTNIVTGKFGWATATYATDYTTTIGASYISNAYSTSLLRMKLLNAGPTDGSATAYAMGTGNANITSLNQTVDSDTRKANVLAPFTLDNSVLTGTNANKSLIKFIATPSQLEYTYWLDWPYAGGLGAGTAYLLNEALTSPMHLPTTVGKSTTTFYGAASNGTYAGYWWNQGVLNYATSTVNHYNDWGDDYVWLPSLSETGYASADGLWATGKTTTGQIKFNNENQRDSATLAGTTVSTERVWLRTGNNALPNLSDFLSSSGTMYDASTAATLAVRPALHLDLTLAEEACAVGVPDEEQATCTYTGSEIDILDRIYNTDRVSFTSVTGKNFDGAAIDTSSADYVNGIFKPTLAGIYTLTLVIKNINDLDWSDGKLNPETQTLTITVNKATPKVAIADPAGDLYTSSMPDITTLSTVTNPVSGVTVAGKISWDDPNPTEGTKDYSWKFTPDDTDNYTVASGVKTLDFIGVELEKIGAKFDSTAKVTTATTLEDLKTNLTVTGYYVDGNSREITSGYTLSGDLSSVGTSTITVKYTDPMTNEEFVTTFTVNVVEPDPENDDNDDSNNPNGGGSTTDPNNPSGGGSTTDPNDPNNPSGGGSTTDPNDPNNPSGGGNTTDPNNPSGGGSTTDPNDPNNPSGGGSTTDPNDPSGGGNTTDPNDPSNTENDDGNKTSGSTSFANFMKKNWWWLLIALAALILFFIIIILLAKRRKDDDEDKKAKKAAAKEEKVQREQEQIRVLQQQQVPLAAASMVAAPVQAVQPVVQPVQQPVVVQQPNYDFSILAEIRADVAELKARQNLPPQINYMPVPQPQNGYAPTPVPQSNYLPAAGGTMDYYAMIAEERARAAEAKLSEERVRTEERARSAEQRAALAEERFLHGGGQSAPVQSSAVPTVVQSGIPAEVVVALLQAVKGSVPAPAQLKPTAQVPPDAVVTTTTTYDTTKNQRAKRESNFDVDGFYDNADY